MENLFHFLPLGLGLILLIAIVGTVFSSFFTVPQGSVYVLTKFGKFSRIAPTGLNFRTPFIEQIAKRISAQNLSVELQFQAITVDQANVYFKCMLMYSVVDTSSETIQKVAFKFSSLQDFNLAMQRTIEGSIRSFVAGKKQNEILGLRQEIVIAVKNHVDSILLDWGYHLLDVQLNDITFDRNIMESMSEVVASANLKAAATNKGEAQLIEKTKEAEATGAAIKIAAQAEMEASKMRGEGVSAFRKAVSDGLKESATELQQAGIDTSLISLSMWNETLKYFADNGKGNVIFLDGSTDNMQRMMGNDFLRGLTKANGSTPTNKLTPSVQ